MSLLLLLLLFLFFSVVPLPSSGQLPAIASSYCTTVAYNFGWLGYSLSYNECYNNAPNSRTLRADGRYASRTTTEMTYFNQQTFVSIDATNTQQPCTPYNLTSAQARSLLYSPSYAIYQLLNYTGFSWNTPTSDTMGDRQIQATHYKSVGIYTVYSNDTFCSGSVCDGPGGMFPSPPYDILELIDFAYSYDPSQYTATFALDYWVVGNTPLRVNVSGTRTNLSSPNPTPQSFSNTYDWVNFLPLNGQTINQKFVPVQFLYQGCISRAATTPIAYRAPFPSSSTVSPNGQIPLYSPPPVSSFPSEFSMILEGASYTNTTGPGLQNSNQPMQYYVDLNGQQEALITQFIGQNNPTIRMWQYNGTIANPQNGSLVWSVTGGNQNCAANYYTFQCWQNTSNCNPLSSDRYGQVGAFQDFFVNSSFVSSLYFIGRYNVRSVPADCYIGTYLKVSNFLNVTLNFTTAVCLYPQGWQYPGRNSISDTRLPLIVRNWGYAVANSTFPWVISYSFNDTWNIYELIPSSNTVDSSWFPYTPSAYALCPSAPGAVVPNRLVNIASSPTEYATTVEINFSTLGYTLSFDEYYSASQGLSRADGRYDSRSTTQITNWAASPVTMAEYNTLAGTCVTYNLDAANQSPSLLFRPTYAILQLLNYTGLQWQTRPTGAQGQGQGNTNVGSIADRDIGQATEYFVTGVTISQNGTFCDANNNCNNGGNILQVPAYSFQELIDFATSPNGEAQNGGTFTSNYKTIIDLHFFQFIFGQTTVPVRLTLNGTKYDTTLPGSPGTLFYNVYDWVNYRQLDPTVFSAISNGITCQPASTTKKYAAPMPSSNNVAYPSNIPLGSPPPSTSFPTEFLMVVEARRNAFFNFNNYNALWSYDAANSQESVATQTGFFGNTRTVYIYQGNNVWTVTGPAGNTSCVQNSATATNANPLNSIRGGVVSFTQLFKQYSTFDKTQLAYMGRSLQRGVSTDWYRGTFYNVPTTSISQWGNVTYTYTTDVFLYPQGWAFPGRASAGDLQLPFLIIQNGTQYNWTVNPNSTQAVTQFTDYYGIFEFFPAADVSPAVSAQSGAWFTGASSYSCPGTTTSTSSSSSGLSGGAVAGIVIGVLAAVAVLLVLVYFYVRSRGSSGGKLSFKDVNDESHSSVNTGGVSSDADENEMTRRA